MSRLLQILKGKSKAPTIVPVNRQSTALHTRLHLINSPETPSEYHYHPNPLAPPLFRLNVSELPDDTISVTLVHVGEGEREELAICRFPDTWKAGKELGGEARITIDGEMVVMRVFCTPYNMTASWGMDIPAHKISKTPSHTSKDAMEKEKEARLEVSDDKEGDDPPPPYSNDIAPGYQEGDFMLKQPLLQLSLASASSPHHLNPETSDINSKRPIPTYLPSTPYPPEPLFTTIPSSLPALSSPLGKETFIPTKFKYDLVSPLARLKLRSTSTQDLLAEFILETSVKKREQGVKGQLLFRENYGEMWQAVVLLTVSVLERVRQGMAT